MVNETEQIEAIEHIQSLARTGFSDWKRYGTVNVGQKDELLIFNYAIRTTYERRWNYFERVSRGLIVHRKTGEIVARPFDKFFNWGEGGRTSNSRIITVTEKIDGSLGILYRTPEGYHIATRGSFADRQAVWATDFLQRYNLTGLPDELTLLFEIIYPENRVVLDYGSREDLVLLAARNRFTGDYLPHAPDVCDLAEKYGFSLPRVYSFESVDDVLHALRALEPNNEGWVVEFADGSRFKFKSSHYLQLQRTILNLTFKNILAAMASGTIDQLLEVVPEEFLTVTRQWVQEIQETQERIKLELSDIFAAAPKESRKDFALWVQQFDPPIKVYLFALYNERDITPLIYRYHPWPDT
jgi:RNA ligase